MLEGKVFVYVYRNCVELVHEICSAPLQHLFMQATCVSLVDIYQKHWFSKVRCNKWSCGEVFGNSMK